VTSPANIKFNSLPGVDGYAVKKFQNYHSIRANLMSGSRGRGRGRWRSHTLLAPAPALAPAAAPVPALASALEAASSVGGAVAVAQEGSSVLQTYGNVGAVGIDESIGSKGSNGALDSPNPKRIRCTDSPPSPSTSPSSSSSSTSSSSSSSGKCNAGATCATPLFDLTEADMTAGNPGDSVKQRLDSRGGTCVTALQHPENMAPPLFYIIGKVDGVSMQIDSTSDDATEWRQVRVVVEIKNRLGHIPAVPPLYDQIQLITYMLMLGTPCGDLVQVVTRAKQCEGKGKGKGKGKDGMDSYGDSSSCTATLSHQHQLSDPPSAARSASSSSPSKSSSTVSSTSSSSSSTFYSSPSKPSSSTSSSSPSSTSPSSTSPSSSSTPTAAPCSNKSKVESAVDFSVCRVMLNAPPYNHKINYINIIIPRLKVRTYCIVP
jgi:hypothetical protein